MRSSTYKDPEQSPAAELNPRKLLLLAIVCSIAIACLVVLRPFLAPIAWATILVYASWPLYRRIRAKFGRFNSTAALVMTVLLTCIVILPVLWLLALVMEELFLSYRAFNAYLAQPPHSIPPAVRAIPWLGDQLQQYLDRYTADPAALGREAIGWMQSWGRELAGLLSGLGRAMASLIGAMLTAFFLYRDGDNIVRQCHRVVHRLFGDSIDPYIATAASMSRTVLFGLLIAAFAQGLVAGIGYAILGIQAPALLGALTGVLSVVPVVGTAIVWVSLSAYLFAMGHLWKAVILLAWGFFLVHPTDNVLRPLLISSAAHVPFLLVMFGAIGGLAAFGLIGAFIGPVILAVGLAVWRAWSIESHPANPP